MAAAADAFLPMVRRWCSRRGLYLAGHFRNYYSTAFEIEPQWLIECAARRQKWIDQAQALNLYIAEPPDKKLAAMHKLAWLRGLKTTYYLRSRGTPSTEKYTTRAGALNAVAATQPCTIHDPGYGVCQ